MPRRSTTTITENWLDRSQKPGLKFCARHSGLGVRVGKTGTKSFVFQRGAHDRVTLGRWPAMSLKAAREKSQSLWNKGAGNVRTGTWAEAFELWEADVRVRHPISAKNTIPVRKAQLNKHISHLWDRQLSSVDSAELKRLHTDLGKQSKNVANDVLRHMKTMWRISTTDPWPGANIRAFRIPKTERKRRVIDDPKFFWSEIQDKCSNPVVRAFWKTAILTGMREADILTARYDNLNDGWLHIPEPKFGSERAFDIPLPKQVLDCIDRLPRQNEWILPGRNSGQHLKDPKPEPIRHLAGVHQTRHIFVEVGRNVCGAPDSVVQTLVNHMKNDSATDLYGLNYRDPEVLKKWSKTIADHLVDLYGME